MRGGPPHETPPARPFAELELLNGSRHGSKLGAGELIRIVPRQCAGPVTILEEMIVPMLEWGRNRGRKRRHTVIIKYFSYQSQQSRSEEHTSELQSLRHL